MRILLAVRLGLEADVAFPWPHAARTLVGRFCMCSLIASDGADLSGWSSVVKRCWWVNLYSFLIRVWPDLLSYSKTDLHSGFDSCLNIGKGFYLGISVEFCRPNFIESSGSIRRACSYPELFIIHGPLLRYLVNPVFIWCWEVDPVNTVWSKNGHSSTWGQLTRQFYHLWNV